ncbi:MAG: GNAT family N-acetyltransferase [Ramlibacter sp.]
MAEDDIDTLERATLAAVPPQQLVALEGWLVALDPGTVRRAHSAVPTRHAQVRHDLLAAIEGHYAGAQLRPSFRIPRVDGAEPLRSLLAARGYASQQPTLTQVGRAHALAAVAAPVPVRLDGAPDEAWAGVFLGEGFDPVDGACRVALLRRGRESVYAAVVQDGTVAAVGSACFSHGWCGIHGMRTARAWRGRGYAGAILAAFGQLALRRGVARVFLLVEQANAPARSLYERAGLRTAWCYDYWRLG